METTTHTLTIETTTGTTGTTRTIGAVPVTVTDSGTGRPVLLLHGGGGPQTVAGFAALLAEHGDSRVVTPIHPGMGGTPRPDGLSTIRELAAVYVGLLDELDLHDVTVIGNSIGGWIAAEMALLASPRITAQVIVDAAGLQLDAHPIVDFFSLTLDQVADLSYYTPDAFRLNLDTMPAAQKAMMAGNRATLAVYSGRTVADPSLLGRLPAIAVPTLVVWGAADRVVPVEHGQAYTAAIPGARFHLIDTAGHLPQLETPGLLLQVVQDFAGTLAPTTTGRH
jgi:pimeloyl-ACP methyl ester carboxylesterase